MNSRLKTLLLASLILTGILSSSAYADPATSWEPVIQLRDITNHFPGTADRPKPDGAGGTG